jgi:hypothetical protein
MDDASSVTSFSGWTNAGLTGVAEDTEAGTSQGNGGGFGVASGTKATAGVVGSTTATCTVSTRQARIAFALAPAGGAAATGTLAATEGADTIALAGDVIVQGSGAATEGADTAAFAGDVLVNGNVAATESGNDVAAFEGAVQVRGAVAASEGADTASLQGDVLIRGTLAATEAGDMASFAGEGAVPPIVGTFNASEGADAGSFAGDVAISGALAASEAGDSAHLTNVEVSEQPSGGIGSRFGEPGQRQEGKAEGANLRIVLLLNPGTAAGLVAELPEPVDTGLPERANRAFARRAYSLKPGKAQGVLGMTEEEQWLLLLAA